MRQSLFSLPVPFATAFAVPAMIAGPHAEAASINAGGRAAKPEAQAPFKVTAVATFDRPWAIAFLPDGRMLVTEKPGRIFLVTQAGRKTPVSGVPKVAYDGQNGLLDIVPAPDFRTSRMVYFSYNAPEKGGSSVTLARAMLHESGGKAELENLTTIWKQDRAARGGQPGGIIAFAPDGKHLFFTVGDRMEPDTAQDPDAPMGKILRMNLDGSVPPDNPQAKAGGVRALTWTTGHRNPYGLAFAPDGKLWEDEMGPRGGDEFNLIRRGRNYGWPLVSNGDNYNGTPIPRHATRPEFAAPPLWWNPVIAPAGLAFYEGNMFPRWRGSALIGGLASEALVRVTIGKDGNADEAERFDMGHRIRDVAVGPDGAVWLIEDGDPGQLLKLTPKK